MGNEYASTEMPKTLDENMNVIDEERELHSNVRTARGTLISRKELNYCEQDFRKRFESKFIVRDN